MEKDKKPSMKKVHEILENTRKEVEKSFDSRKKQIEFLCPICGSKEYSDIYHDVVMGVALPPSHYVCVGCSVVFQNPAKFTKKT
jgi:hypothetical protein